MESMNYWLSELSNKSASTKDHYQKFFQRFCAYTKKTPDELIEQRRLDLKADDPREQHHIEFLLRGFMGQLKDDGLCSSTTMIGFAAVKSFFEANEYPLRTKKSDYPKGEHLGSYVITKQTIREILDNPKTMKDKLKVKALFMVLKDSGLRVSDAANLSYSQVSDGLEKGLEFIPLTLITMKSKTVAKTFLGPEAVNALKLYMDERRKGTRHIVPETITANSPLFRINQNFNGKVKRVTRGSISSIMKWQCRKTGNLKLSAHSFRKYLQTNLDVAGISPNLIDQMLGHKLPNSRDAYSLPSDEQLLKAYMSAYPQLRVYPDKSEVEDRVSKLENDLIDRNGVIVELMSKGNNKDLEFQALKGEVSELKTAVSLMVQVGEAKAVSYRDAVEYNKKSVAEQKNNPLVKIVSEKANIDFEARATELETQLAELRAILKEQKQA
jgi:integrase